MLATVPKVIVGSAFTVPLAATFCVVAPVEAQVTLPEGLPEAAEVSRTYIVVLPTLPPLWLRVILDAKPLPNVVDTSKPVGGVTVIPAVRFEPNTVKLDWVDGVPAQVVNADKVPKVVIVGVAPTAIPFKLMP